MYTVACTTFAEEVNSDIRFPMGNYTHLHVVWQRTRLAHMWSVTT